MGFTMINLGYPLCILHCCHYLSDAQFHAASISANLVFGAVNQDFDTAFETKAANFDIAFETEKLQCLYPFFMATTFILTVHVKDYSHVLHRVIVSYMWV